MKTPKCIKWFGALCCPPGLRHLPGSLVRPGFDLVCRFIPTVLLCLSAAVVHAQSFPPDDSGTPLDSWSFSDTNWLSDLGYASVSFTNLNVSDLGDGNALLLDSTNAAWLRYNVAESDGTTNLTLDQGSLIFWFAPAWSGTNQGGTGPGQWGRLIEVGSFTPDASYGWWSLFVDPDGVNLYFSAQTNGTQADYLSAPISWTTNRWHMIALTYSSTNSALYLDGALATNGSPVTIWPGPDTLAGGFYVGSDSNGLYQARGMFDDMATYNYPLDADTINGIFSSSGAGYWINPKNFANDNLSGAPSSPTITPTFNAITGPGFLLPVSTNLSGCVTSGNIWITNVVATLTTNGTMNLRFAIAGGSNGVPYDVFANNVIGTYGGTNVPWAWMGQGYQCVTYLLTNLPNSSAFLILGTPQDTDQDGLTDAYELLVSKTNPMKPDTIGDGMLDGWKVLWGLNPLTNNTAQPSERSNYGYDPVGWLQTLTGIRSETIGLDAEGNVQTAQ